MALGEKMKVYYGLNSRARGKGSRGWPQKTKWEFEYAGSKRCIPYIYRFSKGIVFDVITILDEGKLREFFKKYGAEGDSLTPMQERCVRQEHPYREMPISRICINGKQVKEGYSSSSFTYMPWATHSNEADMIRKAYPSILKGVDCFGCGRYYVPYPAEDSGAKKLLRFLRMERINEIRLSTFPVDRFLPLDIRICMLADETKKTFSFNHPATGMKYVVFFQNVKPLRLPVAVGASHNLCIMQALYEIGPALPRGDTLLFGSSLQYAENTQASDGEYVPSSAASIGIIGGVDGPMSVFISSKTGEETLRGLHGLPLHGCYSVPSFRERETYEFHLEGINAKDVGSREYVLR